MRALPVHLRLKREQGDTVKPKSIKLPYRARSRIKDEYDLNG
jgi:hypothetical protein